MLVAFETKSYSRVVFFGDVARELLLAMGKSGDVPGAMRGDDVAEALSRLKRRLGAAESHEVADDDDAAAGESGEEEARVDLATRAYPLIELLSAAAANRDDVIWKKA